MKYLTTPVMTKLCVAILATTWLVAAIPYPLGLMGTGIVFVSNLLMLSVVENVNVQK